MATEGNNNITYDTAIFTWLEIFDSNKLALVLRNPQTS